MQFRIIAQSSLFAPISYLLISILLASPLRADSEPVSENSPQDLRQRVAVLEAENADLHKRVTRFRQGLEQAIAELNRLRGQFPKAAIKPTMEQTSPPNTKLETGRRLLSKPRTRVQGRRAEVSGEISNSRRERLGGTLILELLCDGMPIAELQVPFEVPANGRATYTQLFELKGYAAGSYSARVGFIY